MFFSNPEGHVSFNVKTVRLTAFFLTAWMIDFQTVKTVTQKRRNKVVAFVRPFGPWRGPEYCSGNGTRKWDGACARVQIPSR